MIEINPLLKECPRCDSSWEDQLNKKAVQEYYQGKSIFNKMGIDNAEYACICGIIYSFNGLHIFQQSFNHKDISYNIVWNIDAKVVYINYFHLYKDGFNSLLLPWIDPKSSNDRIISLLKFI